MKFFPVVKILSLLARFALAAIFLYSAYAKLKDPWFVFAASIDSYRIVPAGVAIVMAKTLPWFELALGVMLVIGFKVRWVAIVCGLLLCGFWFSMLRAYLKGMDIDCGCFGPGERISPYTLFRDAWMIALSVAVWWTARKRELGADVGKGAKLGT